MTSNKCSLPGGCGRAWIEDGRFHFKRALFTGGRKNIDIALDAITGVSLGDPGVAAYVNQGVHSTVTITMDGGKVERVGNLQPFHGKLLAQFVQRSIDGRTGRG